MKSVRLSTIKHNFKQFYRKKRLLKKRITLQNKVFQNL